MYDKRPKNQLSVKKVKKRRRHYTGDDVKHGINLIKNGQSFTMASKESGVPRKTLHDVIKQNRESTSKPGPKNVLGEKEKSLANYLKYMSKRALPITRKGLQFFALRIFEKMKGKESGASFNKVRGPSYKWCRQFLKRHGLSYRKPEAISKGNCSVSESSIDNYFDLLEKTLSDLDLVSRPDQVYNMDEIGWGSTSKTTPKVIFEKGAPHPVQQDIQVMEHISAVMCGNAAGQMLPPFLIYKGSLPRAGTDDLPSSWECQSTESGFINSRLFNEWLKKSFIPNCGRARPVLLLMDNHSSHLSPEAIDTAITNKIELMCLPPNTTPWAQPLDRVFQHLRREVDDTARTLRLIDSSFVLKKAKFGLALKYAIPRAMTPNRIREAFRVCGIMPLDQSAIDRSYIGINENTRETASVNQTVDTPIQTGPSADEPYKDVAVQTVASDTNHLALLGVIDDDLAAILVPPTPSKPSNTRKRNEARNLTNLTHTAEILHNDHNNTVTRPQSISTSKSDLPTIKRKKSSPLAQKRFTCQVCGTRGLKSDEDNGIMWVGCDHFPECSSWSHYHCLSHGQQADVDLSLLTGKIIKGVINTTNV